MREIKQGSFTSLVVEKSFKLRSFFKGTAVDCATGHVKHIEYKHRGKDKETNSELVEMAFPS